MGVDLTLLVVNLGASNFIASHTMLDLDRDGDLYDAIESEGDAQERPDSILHGYCSRIPDGTMKGECCYGTIEETPYGQPIRYVYASRLAIIMKGFRLDGYNKAARAYVKELPANTLIALYWH